MTIEAASVPIPRQVASTLVKQAVPLSLLAGSGGWFGAKAWGRRSDNWVLWCDAAIVAATISAVVYSSLAWTVLEPLRLLLFASAYGVGLVLFWTMVEGLLEDAGVVEPPEHVPDTSARLQGETVSEQ